MAEAPSRIVGSICSPQIDCRRPTGRTQALACLGNLHDILLPLSSGLEEDYCRRRYTDAE